MALTVKFVDGYDIVEYTDTIHYPALKYDNNSELGQGSSVTGFDGIGFAIQYHGRFLKTAINSADDTFLVNMNVRLHDIHGGPGRNADFIMQFAQLGTPNVPITFLFHVVSPATTPQFAVWVNNTLTDNNPDGNLHTSIWEDSSIIVQDQWYSVQLKFTLSTGKVDLWLDGVHVLNTTITFTSPACNSCVLYGAQTSDVCGDDFVLFTSDTGLDDFPISPIIVTSVVMDANGVNNWIRNTNTYGSNNFNCINEFNGDLTGREDPDGDNSYVISSALNEESYFKDATVIPGANVIALNATWISTSGTQGIKGSLSGTVIEPEKTTTAGATNGVAVTLTGIYYRTDQWIYPGNAAGNWGVQQTSGSPGAKMTQFYLEAVGLGGATDQFYSAQFSISGNTVADDTYTAQFSIAENTPPPPPTPTAPSVTCNPNGPLSIGGSE